MADTHTTAPSGPGRSAPPLWVLALGSAAVAGLFTAAVGLALLNSNGAATERPGDATAATGTNEHEPSRPSVLEPARPIEGVGITDFSLVSSEGRAVGPEVFDGERTALMFIFTNCPFACPGMFAAAEELAAATADDDDPLRFMAISVDPTHDTPERLAEYAAERGLDPERYTLLTGPIEEIERVLDGLLLAIDADERTQIRLDDGSSMANIQHPTRFVLVGPGRQVYGYFSYSEPAERAALVSTARSLDVDEPGDG